MPDAVTSTSSLDFDQTMWDRAIYYALRPELHYDILADVGVTDTQPGKGASVTFTTMNDLTPVTTPLSETADVDAVALSDVQTSITLAEYGSAVRTTYKLHATSFMPLDRPIANVVGFWSGLSLDTISRSIVQAGSNARWPQATQARVNTGATNIITADLVRRMRIDLVNANAASFNGMYAAIIHPDVAYDLRRETGAASWRDPHTYSQPGEIWSGEIGAFEGFRFMETNRAPLFADASNGAGATGTVDVYGTLFMGRQAIAKAYGTYEGRGPVPIVVMGPQTDKLRRFYDIGWHWFGVYGVFRQAALRRLETASSIGANT